MLKHVNQHSSQFGISDGNYIMATFYPKNWLPHLKEDKKQSYEDSNRNPRRENSKPNSKYRSISPDRRQNPRQNEQVVQYIKYKSLLGTFVVTSKIDHSKALVNMIYIDQIKSRPFGTAEMKYNLLIASGIDDIPYKTVENMHIDYFVGQAFERLKRKKVAVHDLDRFREIVANSAIYTYQQYPDLQPKDERMMAGFYFHLGLGLLHAGYEIEPFMYDRTYERHMERIESLHSVILDILKVKYVISGKCSLPIKFKELNVILLCFDAYTEFATKANPHYLEDVFYLITEMQNMYKCQLEILSNKASNDVSFQPLNFLKCYNTWLPVLFEVQLLAYNIVVDPMVRNLELCWAIVQKGVYSAAIIQDMFSFNEEIQNFDRFRNYHTNNLIIHDIIEGKKDIQDAVKDMEAIHNYVMCDIIHLGEVLVENLSDGAEVFVNHFKRLVSSVLKMRFALKYRDFSVVLTTSPLSKMEEVKIEVPVKNDGKLSSYSAVCRDKQVRTVNLLNNRF